MKLILISRLEGRRPTLPFTWLHCSASLGLIFDWEYISPLLWSNFKWQEHPYNNYLGDDIRMRARKINEDTIRSEIQIQQLRSSKRTFLDICSCCPESWQVSRADLASNCSLLPSQRWDLSKISQICEDGRVGFIQNTMIYEGGYALTAILHQLSYGIKCSYFKTFKIQSPCWSLRMVEIEESSNKNSVLSLQFQNSIRVKAPKRFRTFYSAPSLMESKRIKMMESFQTS